MPRLLSSLIALGMAFLLPAWGDAIMWNVADYGIQPGSKDCTAKLLKLLKEAAKSEEPVSIHFPKGTYHFRPKRAEEHELYISNHDQIVKHKVGIPIVGQKNLTINAHGSKFVFHGSMLPILVMDSSNIRCSNMLISYATPFSAEGRIIATQGNKTTLEFNPSINPPWKIEGNRFIINGESGPHFPDCAIVFRKDGMIVPTGRPADIPWKVSARPLTPTTAEFDFNSGQNGYSVGDTIVLRNITRPHPAMLLYRAEDTTLNNVIFHDSQGMAMVAQRSTNIHIKGGGCLNAPGRKHSASADACHFSNCRGSILVEKATFEGMMDDAINVHATCLRIDDISEDRRNIRVTYVHRQAYGFETFAAGESLRFIRAKTLENEEQTTKVTEVQVDSPQTMTLKLAEPVPDNIQTGDAVENADWHPSVIFRNNIVRNNRARGALFTTPKPVLVEGNRFIHSSGSAILLAGDAAGWYESGACGDVTIRSNLFDHNLTCRYQFTEGIICIYPEVAMPQQQTKRYHRNILIEKNVFKTHHVPLLYAISADKVRMRNNTVKYDDSFSPMHDGKASVIQHCGEISIK